MFIKINEDVVNDAYHCWRDHGTSQIGGITDDQETILTINVSL